MINGRPSRVDDIIGEEFNTSSARISVDKVFFPNLTVSTAKSLLAGEEIRFGNEVAGEITVSAIGMESKERMQIGEWPVQGRINIKKDEYSSLDLYRGNEAILMNMSDIIKFKSDSVKDSARVLISDKLLKSCEKMIDLDNRLNIGRDVTQKELSALQAVKDYGFDYIIDSDSGKFFVSDSENNYSADNEFDMRWQSEMYLDGVPKPLIAAIDICQGIEREFDKHHGIDTYNNHAVEIDEPKQELGL